MWKSKFNAYGLPNMGTYIWQMTILAKMRNIEF